jgi:ligand-binding sensor domain-containing protein
MNRLRNIAVLLCFNFVIAFSALAQFKFDKPILITKENGLPVNEFPSVKKGDDGFIWIGSSEGLCRFDGLQVKVFQEGSDLRYSLFDNWINTVEPTKDHVWMGTDQGLSVLNTKDYTFRHYQLANNGKTDSLKRRFDQHINTLYKDKTGNIWIGTRWRGACTYDETKDNFRFFPVPADKYPPLIPSLGPSSSILGFEESRTNDSIIWAGTTAGLQEINKYTGQVRLFTFPQKNKDYQVALNVFRRPYHHDDGLLYIGSWAASVNIFDPVAETFTPLRVKNEKGQKILNSPIGKFIRKSDHEIWISTSAGVVVYDSKLKDVTWYKSNNPEKNEFYAIDFFDKDNRAWHGDINGLSYFDPAMQQFARYSFKHLVSPEMTFAFYILSDKQGDNLTVCPRFAGGIFHFNKLKKEWTKSLFPSQNTFLKEEDAVRGFVQLRSGEYIISSNHGLFLYSEKKNKINSLQGIPPFSASTRGEIILDRTGNLWISDDTQGLVKWNPETREYRVYKDGLLSKDTSEFSGRIKEGFYGRLNNFFEDSRGNVWFQKSTGFGVYVVEKDSILNFIYAKNEKNSFPTAHSFAEDKTGRIWILSADGWIGYSLASDPARGVVYKFNMRERGMQNYIQKLATDKNGEVWGYNSKELVKINANDLSFTTYSFQYGVDEADFFHFSFLPSGEIIFGGRNDIIIANPAELKRNTEIPVPYITEMQVLNKPLRFVMNGSPVNLRHKQNFFSIGFSAQAYTMAKDVKFRYRLYDFDEWTEVTGRRFASYTNVPGGDYVFQLQAANNEGVWNEKIIEMPIHIGTPFWQTWWFRIAFVLVIALAAYWLYRFRVDQVKKKQRLKSEYEKKLANVEMSALLAQMNPHFLFNSLNSIDSYIIRNESKKASEYLNNFARLMRLILQNSRSNYINLKDELEALDLYMQMESLRFKNKFSYSIAVDESVETSSIVIPPMLIQPYVENAIWHGLMHKTNGTEGLVKINISKNADDLLCVIEDNGIGRKKATEIKEQKQKNHKRSMGMQITQDRIEIINKLYNMNASINIYDMEDELGNAKGTKVELIIPV